MWASSEIQSSFQILRGNKANSDTVSLDANPQATSFSNTQDSLSISNASVGISDPVLRNRLIDYLESSQGVLFSADTCSACLRYLVAGSDALQSPNEVALVHRFLRHVQDPDVALKLGLSFEDMSTIYDSLRHCETCEAQHAVNLSQSIRDGIIASDRMSDTELKYRRRSHLIDSQDPRLGSMVDNLFKQGTLRRGMSVKDVSAAVLSHIQSNFSYAADKTGDYWQSVSETLDSGHGDCEDLAVLTASVMMNALRKQGVSEVEIREMVSLSAGYIDSHGQANSGHVVVKVRSPEGELALDAASTFSVQDFASIGLNEVFEMNDRHFLKKQTIDSNFETAVRITIPPGQTFTDPETLDNFASAQFNSLADEINARMHKLGTLISRNLDIPRLRNGNLYRKFTDVSNNGNSSTGWDIVSFLNKARANAAARRDTTFYRVKDGQFHLTTMRYQDILAGNWIHVPGKNELLFKGRKDALIDTYGSASARYFKVRTDDTGREILDDNGNRQYVGYKSSEFRALGPETEVYRSVDIFGDMGINTISIGQLKQSFGKGATDTTAAVAANSNLVKGVFGPGGQTVGHYEDFEFFTIKNVEIPFSRAGNESMYQVEIKEDVFYKYITDVRDEINRVILLFHAAHSMQEHINNIATDIYVSDMSDYEKSHIKDDTDNKQRNKFIQTMDKWHAKIGSSVRDISGQMFNFISVTNQAEATRAQYTIDMWPRKPGDPDSVNGAKIAGNVALGLLGSLADELTGIISTEKAQAKFRLSQISALITARNARSRVELAKLMTKRVILWSETDEKNREVEIRSGMDTGNSVSFGEEAWNVQDTSLAAGHLQTTRGLVSRSDLLQSMAAIGGSTGDGGDIQEMIELINTSDFNPLDPNVSVLYWTQDYFRQHSKFKPRYETAQNLADNPERAHLFNLASDSRSQPAVDLGDVDAPAVPASDPGRQLQEKLETINNLKIERETIESNIAAGVASGVPRENFVADDRRLAEIFDELEALYNLPTMRSELAKNQQRLDDIKNGIATPVNAFEESNLENTVIPQQQQDIADAEAKRDSGPEAVQPTAGNAIGDGQDAFDQALPASAQVQEPTAPPLTQSNDAMFLDYNMPRQLDIRQSMISYQNYMRAVLLIKQTMMDRRREIAEEVGGMRSTASAKILARSTSQALESELMMQNSALDSALNETKQLSSAMNNLVLSRIDYYKAKQREIMNSTRTALYIAIEVTSIVVGTSLSIFGSLIGLNKPYFSYMLNTIATGVVDAAMAGWGLGIEERVKEFYSPTVIQTSRNNYNSRAAIISQNQSTANLTDFDADKKFELFTGDAAGYFDNEMNRIRANAQRLFGEGGEKTFYNGAQSFRDNVPVFVADRGDGYYVKDGYSMFLRDGPGNFDGQAFSNYGLEDTDDPVWSYFNNIKQQLHILYLIYDAVEEAARELVGASKQAAVQKFDAYVDAYIEYERAIVNGLKSEVDAVISAANHNAGKDKRLQHLRYDLLSAGVKAALTGLSAVPYDPLGRALVMASSMVVDQADLMRKKVFGPYAGLHANFRNHGNTPSIIRSRDNAIPNAPFSVANIDPAQFNAAGVSTTDLLPIADAINLRMDPENLRTDLLDTTTTNIDQLEARIKQYSPWHRIDEEEKGILRTMYAKNSDSPTNPTALPFISVDFQNAIDTNQALNRLFTSRTMLLMVEQAIYHAKQQAIKDMFGSSTSANILQKAMALVDRYNQSQLDSVQDLLAEFQSRSEAYNTYQAEALALSIEQSSLAVMGLIFYMYRPKAPGDDSEGGGTKYMHWFKRVMASQLSRIVAQATGNVVLSVIGLTTEIDSPKTTSEFLNYEEDPRTREKEDELEAKKSRANELEEKESSGVALSDEEKKELDTLRGDIKTLEADISRLKVEGRPGEVTRRQTKVDMGINKGNIKFSGGGTVVLSSSSKAIAKAKVNRKARQVQLLREISLAMADAKADAAGEIGVSSSKSYRAILNIINKTKQTQLSVADLLFQAAQVIAKQRNQNFERMQQAATQLISQGIKSGVQAGVRRRKKKQERLRDATSEGREMLRQKQAIQNQSAMRDSKRLNELKSSANPALHKKEIKRLEKQQKKSFKEIKKTNARLNQINKTRDTLDKRKTGITQKLNDDKATLSAIQMQPGVRTPAENQQMQRIQSRIDRRTSKLDQTNNLIKFGTKEAPAPTASEDKLSRKAKLAKEEQKALNRITPVNGVLSQLLSDMLISLFGPAMVNGGGPTNAFGVAAEYNNEEMVDGASEEEGEVIYDAPDDLIQTGDLENAILGMELEKANAQAMMENMRGQNRMLKAMGGFLKNRLIYVGKTLTGINEESMKRLEEEMEREMAKAIARARQKAGSSKISIEDAIAEYKGPPLKLGLRFPEIRLKSKTLKPSLAINLNMSDHFRRMMKMQDGLMGYGTGLKTLVMGTGHSTSKRDIESTRQAKLFDDNSARIQALQQKGVLSQTESDELAGREAAAKVRYLETLQKSKGELTAQQEKALDDARKDAITIDKSTMMGRIGYRLGQVTARRGFMGLIPFLSTFRVSEPTPGASQFRANRDNAEYQERQMSHFVSATMSVMKREKRVMTDIVRSVNPDHPEVLDDMQANLLTVFDDALNIQESLLTVNKALEGSMTYPEMVAKGLDEEQINFLKARGAIREVPFDESSPGEDGSIALQFRIGILSDDEIQHIRTSTVGGNPIPTSFVNYLQDLSDKSSVHHRQLGLIESRLNNFGQLNHFNFQDLVTQIASRTGASLDDAGKMASAILLHLKKDGFLHSERNQSSKIANSYRRLFSKEAAADTAFLSGDFQFTKAFFDRRLASLDGKDSVDAMLSDMETNGTVPHGQSDALKGLMMEFSASDGALKLIVEDTEALFTNVMGEMDDLMTRRSMLDLASSELESISQRIKELQVANKELSDTLMGTGPAGGDTPAVYSMQKNEDGSLQLVKSTVDPTKIKDQNGTFIALKSGDQNIAVLADPNILATSDEIKDAAQDALGLPVDFFDFDNNDGGHDADDIDRLQETQDKLITQLQVGVEEAVSDVRRLEVVASIVNNVQKLQAHVSLIKGQQLSNRFILANVKSGTAETDLESLLGNVHQLNGAQKDNLIQVFKKQGFISQGGALTDLGLSSAPDSAAGFAAFINANAASLGFSDHDLPPEVMDQLEDLFSNQRYKSTLRDDILKRGGRSEVDEIRFKEFQAKVEAFGGSSHKHRAVHMSADIVKAENDLAKAIEKDLSSIASVSKKKMKASFLAAGKRVESIEALTRKDAEFHIFGRPSFAASIGAYTGSGKLRNFFSGAGDGRLAQKLENSRVGQKYSGLLSGFRDFKSTTRMVSPSEQREMAVVQRQEALGINPNDVIQNFRDASEGASGTIIGESIVHSLQLKMAADLRGRATNKDIEDALFSAVQSAGLRMGKIINQDGNYEMAAEIFLAGIEKLNNGPHSREMASRFGALAMQKFEQESPETFQHLADAIIRQSDGSSAQGVVDRVFGDFISGDTRFFENVRNRNNFGMNMIGRIFENVDGLDDATDARETLRIQGLDERGAGRGDASLEALSHLSGLSALISRLDVQDIMGNEGYMNLLRSDAAFSQIMFALIDRVESGDQESVQAIRNLSSAKGIRKMSDLITLLDAHHLSDQAKNTLLHEVADISTYAALTQTLAASGSTEGLAQFGRSSGLFKGAILDSTVDGSDTGKRSKVETNLEKLSDLLHADPDATIGQLDDPDAIVDLAILLQLAIKNKATNTANKVLTKLGQLEGGQEILQQLTPVLHANKDVLKTREVSFFFPLNDNASFEAVETKQRASRDTLRFLLSDSAQSQIEDGLDFGDEDEIIAALAKSAVAAYANRATFFLGDDSHLNKEVVVGDEISRVAARLLDGPDDDDSDRRLAKFAQYFIKEVSAINPSFSESMKIRNSAVIDGLKRNNNPSETRLAEVLNRAQHMLVFGSVTESLRGAQYDDTRNEARLTFQQMAKGDLSDLESVFRMMIVDGNDRNAAIALMSDLDLITPVPGADDYMPAVQQVLSSVVSSITPKAYSSRELESIERFFIGLQQAIAPNIRLAVDAEDIERLERIHDMAHTGLLKVRDALGNTRFQQEIGEAPSRLVETRKHIRRHLLENKDSNLGSVLGDEYQANLAFIDDYLPDGSGIFDIEELREVFKTIGDKVEDGQILSDRDIRDMDTTLMALERGPHAKTFDADTLTWFHTMRDLALGAMYGASSRRFPETAFKASQSVNGFTKLFLQEASVSERDRFIQDNPLRFRAFLSNASLDDDTLDIFLDLAKHPNTDLMAPYARDLVDILDSHLSMAALVDITGINPPQNDPTLQRLFRFEGGQANSNTDIDVFGAQRAVNANPNLNPTQRQQLMDLYVRNLRVDHLEQVDKRNAIIDALQPHLLGQLKSSTPGNQQQRFDQQLQLALMAQHNGHGLPLDHSLKAVGETLLDPTVNDTVRARLADAEDMATFASVLYDNLPAPAGGSDPLENTRVLLEKFTDAVSESDADSTVWQALKQNDAAAFQRDLDTDGSDLRSILSDSRRIGRMKDNDPAAYLSMLLSLAQQRAVDITLPSSVERDVDTVLSADLALFSDYVSAKTDVERRQVVDQFFTTGRDDNPAEIETAWNTRQDIFRLFQLDAKQFKATFGETSTSLVASDLDGIAGFVNGHLPVPAPGAPPANAVKGSDIIAVLTRPHKPLSDTLQVTLRDAAGRPTPGILTASGNLHSRYLLPDGRVNEAELENDMSDILDAAFNINDAATLDRVLDAVLPKIVQAHTRRVRLQDDLEVLSQKVLASEMTQKSKESGVQLLSQTQQILSHQSSGYLDRILRLSKEAESHVRRSNRSAYESSINKIVVYLHSMAPELIEKGTIKNEDELNDLLDLGKGLAKKQFELVKFLETVSQKYESTGSPREKQLILESRTALSTALLFNLVYDADLRRDAKDSINDFIKSLRSLGEGTGLKGKGNPVHTLMHSHDQSPTVMKSFLSLFDGLDQKDKADTMEALIEHSGIFNLGNALQMSRMLDLLEYYPAGAARIIDQLPSAQKKADVIDQLFIRGEFIDWANPDLRNENLQIDSAIEPLLSAHNPKAILDKTQLVKNLVAAGAPGQPESENAVSMLAYMYRTFEQSPMAQVGLREIVSALDPVVAHEMMHEALDLLDTGRAPTASLMGRDNLSLKDQLSAKAQLDRLTHPDPAVVVDPQAFDTLMKDSLLAVMRIEPLSKLLNAPPAIDPVTGEAHFSWKSPPGDIALAAGKDAPFFFKAIQDVIINPLNRRSLIEFIYKNPNFSHVLSAVIMNDSKGDYLNDKTVMALLDDAPALFKETILGKRGKSGYILDGNVSNERSDLLFAALSDRLIHNDPLPRSLDGLQDSQMAKFMQLSISQGKLDNFKHFFSGKRQTAQVTSILANVLSGAGGFNNLSMQDALTILNAINSPSMAQSAVLEAIDLVDRQLPPGDPNRDNTFESVLRFTIGNSNFMRGLDDVHRDLMMSRLMQQLEGRTYSDEISTLFTDQFLDADSLQSTHSDVSDRAFINETLQFNDADSRAIYQLLYDKGIIDDKGQFSKYYDGSDPIMINLGDLGGLRRETYDRIHTANAAATRRQLAAVRSHINETAQNLYLARPGQVNDMAKTHMARLVFNLRGDFAAKPNELITSLTALGTVPDNFAEDYAPILINALDPSIPMTAAQVAAQRQLMLDVATLAESADTQPIFTQLLATEGFQRLVFSFPAGRSPEEQALYSATQSNVSRLSREDALKLVENHVLRNGSPSSDVAIIQAAKKDLTVHGHISAQTLSDLQSRGFVSGNRITDAAAKHLRGRSTETAPFSSPAVTILMGELLKDPLLPGFNLDNELSTLRDDPVYRLHFLSALSKQDNLSWESPPLSHLEVTGSGKHWEALDALFSTVASPKEMQLRRRIASRLQADFLAHKPSDRDAGFKMIEFLVKHNPHTMIMENAFQKTDSISAKQSLDAWKVLNGQSGGKAYINDAGHLTEVLDEASKQDIKNRLLDAGLKLDQIDHVLSVLESSRSVKNTLKTAQLLNHLYVSLGESPKTFFDQVDTIFASTTFTAAEKVELLEPIMRLQGHEQSRQGKLGSKFGNDIAGGFLVNLPFFTAPLRAFGRNKDNFSSNEMDLRMLRRLYEKKQFSSDSDRQVFAKLLASSMERRRHLFMSRRYDLETPYAKFLHTVLRHDMQSGGGQLFSELQSHVGGDAGLDRLLARQLDLMYIYDGKMDRGDMSMAIRNQVDLAVDNKQESALENIIQSLSITGSQDHDISWIHEMAFQSSLFDANSFSSILPDDSTLDMSSLLGYLSSPENGYLAYDAASQKYVRTAKEIKEDSTLFLGAYLDTLSPTQKAEVTAKIRQELMKPHTLMNAMIKVSLEQINAISGQSDVSLNPILFSRKAFTYDESVNPKEAKAQQERWLPTTRKGKLKKKMGRNTFHTFMKPDNYLSSFLDRQGASGSAVLRTVHALYHKANSSSGAAAKSDGFRRGILSRSAKSMVAQMVSAPTTIKESDLSYIDGDITAAEIRQDLLKAGYITEDGKLTTKFKPSDGDRLEGIAPELMQFQFEIKQTLTQLYEANEAANNFEQDLLKEMMHERFDRDYATHSQGFYGGVDTKESVRLVQKARAITLELLNESVDLESFDRDTAFRAAATPQEKAAVEAKHDRKLRVRTMLKSLHDAYPPLFLDSLTQSGAPKLDPDKISQWVLDIPYGELQALSDRKDILQKVLDSQSRFKIDQGRGGHELGKALVLDAFKAPTRGETHSQSFKTAVMALASLEVDAPDRKAKAALLDGLDRAAKTAKVASKTALILKELKPRTMEDFKTIRDALEILGLDKSEADAFAMVDTIESGLMYRSGRAEIKRDTLKAYLELDSTTPVTAGIMDDVMDALVEHKLLTKNRANFQINVPFGTYDWDALKTDLVDNGDLSDAQFSRMKGVFSSIVPAGQSSLLSTLSGMLVDDRGKVDKVALDDILYESGSRARDINEQSEHIQKQLLMHVVLNGSNMASIQALKTLYKDFDIPDVDPAMGGDRYSVVPLADELSAADVKKFEKRLAELSGQKSVHATTEQGAMSNLDFIDKKELFSDAIKAFKGGHPPNLFKLVQDLNEAYNT